MAERIHCPVCMHDETMRARLDGREPCYDDGPEMDFVRPRGGVRGQLLSQHDRGTWVCRVCAVPLTPRDAGVLLDAALMHRDPDCDSIVDGVHMDARRAFGGGDR